MKLIPFKINLNALLCHAGVIKSNEKSIALFYVMIRDRLIYRGDIWVLPIYQYQPKQPILSASVSVDKMLLYSSCMQTTCTRKHNEPSQDSYLVAMPAGAFSLPSRQDEPWSTRWPLQPKQKHHH